MSDPQPPAPFGVAAAASQIGSQLQYNWSRSDTPREEDEEITIEEAADSIEKDMEIKGMGKKERSQLVQLARQFSEMSQLGGHPPNPFLDPEADPELNPTSTQFNAAKWAKNFLRFVSCDPDRYPRRTAGVSFQNLNVYGFGTAADYQMNVANAWLKAAGWLRSLIFNREKIRIDILRDFEGLVRSGEMLVVLGRPGRCVSEFLTGGFQEWTMGCES